MAKIEHTQKACIVSCTKQEWTKFQEAYIDEGLGYEFPPLLVHELNSEKHLPENIVDLTEMSDLMPDEFERNVMYMQECFDIPVDTIKEYGIMQFYYEDI